MVAAIVRTAIRMWRRVCNQALVCVRRRESRLAGPFRSGLRYALMLALILIVGLKLLDLSWLSEMDRPIGYLTLSGLICELLVVALLSTRNEQLAGVSLFAFGLGIIVFTPLIPSCKCLGPLVLTRSQRTVFGIVFGLIGACLFLWPNRPSDLSKERMSL